jgi:predicted alpha-1,6-mannanase (GH76 family)
MTRRRAVWTLLVTLALAATAAAVVSGCGSSAEGAAPTASPAPSLSFGPPSAKQPPGPESLARRAALALGAFEKAFYRQSGKGAYDADSTAGRRSDFWRQAELIEMEEDAYQVDHVAAAGRRVVALMDGVIALHGRDWTGHAWNDDIMWMVIAAARAYEITGDASYLAMAQQNFDATYARAWSSELGGGLWWTADHTQKNTTTNGPAAIAACLLAKDLADRTYLVKARSLYGWIRGTLFDPATGAVWDRVEVKGGAPRVSQAQITYNEGTFVGAAELLFRATADRSYYRDALLTMTYTELHMTSHGILPAEAGTNANLGGFKGIFCRYAGAFIRGNGVTRFTSWLRRNADVAWAHRDGRGLIWADWSRQTATGDLRAWDCSSAVVLLLTVARL